MKTFKSEALERISRLPDDAGADDIIYELYVLDQIRQGLDDVERGDTITTEEFKEEIKKW